MTTTRQSLMNQYISTFPTLNTAKIAGKQAPHKAVLLLAIMDLVEDGVITSPKIVLTEKLEETFGKVWKHYIGSSLIFTPKVATPFWHMQNEPFYRLYMNNGQLISGGTGRYSIPWLRENTYAMIDPELLALMQDTNARAELRTVLIGQYLQGLHAGVDGKALASAFITILGMMLQTAA